MICLGQKCLLNWRNFCLKLLNTNHKTMASCSSCHYLFMQVTEYLSSKPIKTTKEQTIIGSYYVRTSSCKSKRIKIRSYWCRGLSHRGQMEEAFFSPYQHWWHYTLNSKHMHGSKCHAILQLFQEWLDLSMN